MKLDDFDFRLPNNLIASHPVFPRSASRLLVAQANSQTLIDSHFIDLANFLAPGDLIVFNDTRVIPARLYAHKLTGAKVEFLIERLLEGNQAWVHCKSNKSLKEGQKLILEDQSQAEIKGRMDRLFIVQFEQDLPLLQRLENIGHIPLPPYLQRQEEAEDSLRYQTVYAKKAGSVAAPTAGLHFDAELLQKLKEKNIEFAYLTLHVGAGTFLPIQSEDIAGHKMHTEYFSLTADCCEKIIAAKSRANKVIAVGTTSLRCLESCAQNGMLFPQEGETDLFITPGFKFQIVDGLITNFHLPKSTLRVLVGSFIGLEFANRIYQHAILEKYRFYSYGDGSLLLR